MFLAFAPSRLWRIVNPPHLRSGSDIPNNEIAIHFPLNFPLGILNHLCCPGCSEGHPGRHMTRICNPLTACAMETDRVGLQILLICVRDETHPELQNSKKSILKETHHSPN
jgi:hypothetical protein